MGIWDIYAVTAHVFRVAMGPTVVALFVFTETSQPPGQWPFVLYR